MARFYKRGKTWTYCMDIGYDKDGNRDRKTKGGFRTKKDAEEAAAALQIELSQGTYYEEKDTTFADFAKDWLERYGTQVKKGTVRIRQHEIDKLKHYFNLIKLKDITKKQYQDALYDLQKRGYAENTISGVHGTAKMIFAKAVELDVVKKDPTEFARPPRKQETLAEIESAEDVPAYLEKEQLAAFLRMAHDGGLKNDYTIFLVLAYTGIRAGELCALKWSDVDFESNTIRITRTYYNPSNNLIKYELVPPKTKASRRTIEVTARVIEELQRHQARQELEKNRRQANGEVWHDEGFIFCVDKYPGYPAYVKLIETRMARLLRLSELNEDLTPHSLRHTHTSLLAEAGVGLEEIMERLGHADDDTTRKVYLHVTQTMKKEAAHKFSQLMDNL